jgi:uncharacterized protein (TIGR04255 family)
MKTKWPTLKNPPIILAVVELRFTLPDNFDILRLKRDDGDLLKKYPNRLDNFTGNINLPSPVAGLTSATVDSRQIGYIYTNIEKSRKVIISKENLVYAQEGNYSNWIAFKAEWSEIISHFSFVLNELIVERLSIRFVNQIVVSDLNSPLDYFKSSISAQEGVIKYPVDLYFYRYVMRVPDSLLRVIVINSLQEISATNYTFIFDIDVLNDEHFKFNIERISEIMENLREKKNETFFNNITDKTLSIIS